MKVYMFVLVFFTLLAVSIGCSQLATAGMGTLLETRLDMAKSVVIGEITDIVETNPDSKQSTRMGNATIAVSEVLKGSSVETLEMKCIVWRGPNYAGSGPAYANKIGDSGIWVINADGTLVPDAIRGFVPEKRRSDVVSMLKQLDEREWSAPVNGLRAWSGVVQPDKNRNPVIIFAVQNISDIDIYVPNEITPRFITANANDGKKSYYYKLVPKGVLQKEILCRKLTPGGIVYLHPSYTSIDLRWKQSLPLGDYKVDISCQNTKVKGKYSHFNESALVQAWTGKLTAPAVELIIKKEKPSGTPAVLK